MHNRTGEACPEESREQRRRALEAGSTSRLHFGSRKRLHLAGHGARRGAMVAVTNRRLDFDTWERIFQDQAEWLAQES
jgi:hypothetical protein